MANNEQKYAVAYYDDDGSIALDFLSENQAKNDPYRLHNHTPIPVSQNTIDEYDEIENQINFLLRKKQELCKSLLPEDLILED